MEKHFYNKPQSYLVSLYKTILAIGYYGLFRIGELVKCNTDEHTIRVHDVQIAQNKRKILILLYSSKTLLRGGEPHRIKIKGKEHEQSNNIPQEFFCPFSLIKEYSKLKGDFVSDDEQFFTFRDGTSVEHTHIRNILREMIKKIGLDPKLYNTHSLRSG